MEDDAVKFIVHSLANLINLTATRLKCRRSPLQPDTALRPFAKLLCQAGRDEGKHFKQNHSMKTPTPDRHVHQKWEHEGDFIRSGGRRDDSIMVNAGLSLGENLSRDH